ncbi:MAG: T9SS type A sorting domain-containing protein [Bacteroidota bacterium]|nr:T9SS type A sorting domain-containing protein [Bacteroidota bacterium]
MKITILNLKNVFLSISILLFSISSLNAQTNFQWAKNMGSNTTDFGYAIAVDAFGNSYTTGFFNGTSDFDPGPGTFTLASSGSDDIFISKLDVNGNFVWAKKIGGAASEMGRSITIDGTGNINLTGYFQGTVDFDPNAGVTNLNAAGSNDIFVLKLNSSGNLVWAKNLGGTSDDKGQSITSDAAGNVFTTGYFNGTADFDPSASTFTMNGLGGTQSVFISKLDASGNFVWAKQFNAVNGSPQIFGNSIKLDGSGNVCIGGSFTGNVDFDPGAGTYSLAAINMDIFISKLDASGNFIWTKSMGGTSGSNTANSIAIDAASNIYATGYFDQTTDFDPSAGTFNLTSLGGVDIFVLKLDASGSFVWAKKMGSTTGDQGMAIALSNSGDVYTTGYFSTAGGDFDPGPSTYTLGTLGGNTVFLSKLDASGNFVFAYSYSNSSSVGWGLVVTPIYDIYTVGNFSQNTDFDLGSGIYTLTPAGGGGSDDIFVQKLGQSVCPTFSLNSTTSSYTLMCALNTLTLNAAITTTLAGVSFTWTAPSLTTSTGSSYTCTTAGIYTISATASSNTCIVTQTLSIIQSTGNVAFNVSTNGSTCNNNGTASVTVTSGLAPYTYTWSTASNSIGVTGLAPGNYSVVVKDANQCSARNTFVINNIAPSFSSVPICFVTVDSISQHNVITWDKTLFSSADSFFVYRETGTNTYKKIQSQPYSAFSQFVDTVKTLYFPNTGNPNVGTYRYKLMTRDNCGNYSTFSPYHNTLFLINNNGTFSWTQLYQIEGDPNPVLAYILERDNLSTGNWQAIGSVSGTQQFIIDPSYSSFSSTASWRVKTQWNVVCIPSKLSSSSNSSSYSNRITNVTIGIKENKLENALQISPNPSLDIFNVSLKTNGGKNYNLKVINSIGEVVYTNNGAAFSTIQVDLSKNAVGIYFVVLKTNNQTITKKIIKE